MNLKIGNIVQLKTGGSSMTVVGFLDDKNAKMYEKDTSAGSLKIFDENTNEYVLCEWCDEKDCIKTSAFHISTLKKKE
jgi:uncharacterized protein YodC (DUF2158 family)